MCANDVQRIHDVVVNFMYVFSCIPAVGAAVYSVFLLELWGLFGFLVFFSFFPVQVCKHTVYSFHC